MNDLGTVYRRYLACCNERRFDDVTQFVHDPICRNGEWRSLAQYVGNIRANTEAVPDFHWEIEDLVANDSTVAVRLTDTGTPRKEWLSLPCSGRSMMAHEFAIYRFRDGKISEMWFLLDVQAIQACLAPQAAG